MRLAKMGALPSVLMASFKEPFVTIPPMKKSHWSGTSATLSRWPLRRHNRWIQRTSRGTRVATMLTSPG